MKFGTFLLLVALIYAILSTHSSVRRSRTAEERFFAIRASAFTWLIGILLLTAFIFLPCRPRVLLMIPAFFIVTSLAKFWRNGRERLRRKSETRVDFERMKRVN